jgi:O-acetyl-ADP-ribose deacetylase (regulator of RNase III)
MVAQEGTSPVRVEVVSGDIAQIKADALITAINSGGMWFGGIDGVIERHAGLMFHKQAASQELHDGMVVIATATGLQHAGEFGDVVFVVDDLQQPLRNIVALGLRAADEAGYESVTLPTIRMGAMLGVVEKNIQEAFREMRIGLKTALRDVKNLESVTFVVYEDPGLEHLLRVELTA